MEVQYFTECDFINRDLVDNFPDLMAGTKTRGADIDRVTWIT
jgi:hypothetical protein